MKHEKQERNSNCHLCDTKKAYSERYDAYYCPKCLFWLEPICPGRDCEYCSERPKYPEEEQE